MAPRQYSMKQNSYWRVKEWNFLEQAVGNPDVQEYVAKGELNHARAVLGGLFRAEFTGPSGAEKEEDFKRRMRWTKKARKGLIVRRRAETQEEWEARMAVLNDRLAQWLINWRGRGRRGQLRQWNPRAIGVPKTRKPRAQTAFDAYCKSDDAPKGSDFIAANGSRCDLAALNAARASAWKGLSAEEQANYVATAQEAFEGPGGSPESSAEEPVQDASEGPVATAEAIVSYVDEFVDVMHNDVRWGGFVILGGPDHSGEACIHSQTAGTNRNGQTFLDALLQVIGWTPLDFDTVFSLWLEQCRQGPQDADDRTFAEAARRAVQHSRAQAAAESSVGTGSDVGPRGAFAAMGSAATAQSASDAAAVVEALNKLTLAIQPRSTSVAVTAAEPVPIEHGMNATGHDDTEDASATAGDSVLASAFSDLSRGTRYVNVDSHILEAMAANPGFNFGYDVSCTFSKANPAEDAMDWQSAQHAAHDDGVMLSMPPNGCAATTHQGSVANVGHGNIATRKPRQRKPAEPSGVAMPGLRGLPVLERVLRPRNTRNREDTMDGTLPLTRRGAN